LHDCIIDGEIPRTIDGTFYRVAADTLHVPKHPKVPSLPKRLNDQDVPFNGDGAIAAFRIRDGGVDFRTKFVRTEKFVRERAARRALVGQYRNPFTDDPAVAGTNRTTANTNVVWLYGHLLALKEDALPYELDPHTLETIGTYDFAKQYTAPTFTAHPKVDPSNGETICYGYETKGLGSKDVKYVLFDKEGKKIEDFDFQAPYCGLMHDVAFTANFVIFQIYPRTFLRFKA
jgi:carotenoid cleavage dioxygenase-like enzyme